MSMYTGYAYDAFRDDRERVRRRKSELAQAFETYKQNNPYATYEDYQNFIDSQLDFGENYLRGGVASDNLLRRLSNENQKKKAEAEQLSRMDEAMQKLNLADKFGQSGRRFLGSTESLEKDREAFLRQLGVDPSVYDPAAFTDMYGVDPLGGFTQPLRDEVIQDRMSTLQPQIDRYIGSLGGDVTPEKLQQRFPNMMIPLADQITLIERAQENAARAEDDILFKYRDRLTDYLKSTPDVSPEDALSALNAMGGGELKSLTGKSAFTQESIAPLMEQFNRDQAEEREEETRRAKASVAGVQDTLLSNEIVATAIMRDKEEALSTLAEQFKLRLSPKEIRLAFGLEEGQNLSNDNQYLNDIYQQYFDFGEEKLRGAAQERRSQFEAELPALLSQERTANTTELQTRISNQLGNEGVSNVLAGRANAMGYDASSPQFSEALEAFRQQYMAGRDFEDEISGDQLNSIVTAFNQTMQAYSVPSVEGRLQRFAEDRSDRSRIYDVAYPKDVIQKENEDTTKMISETFQPRLGEIQTLIDNGELDRAASMIRSFKLAYENTAGRIQSAADAQYDAQTTWRLQTAPEDFAAQISGHFETSMAPLNQELSRLQDQLMQAMNNPNTISRNDLVEFSNEEIAQMDAEPLRLQSNQITNSIGRNIDLINQYLDIQSQGRIATDATRNVTPSSMFATPEEQIYAESAPGDAFLTVEQRGNAVDKQRQMKDQRNVDSVTYRLGVAPPAVANALLSDLKNPDVTWDEITEKYQLNVDTGTSAIGNARDRYTNTSIVGTVRRPIQPQKKN